MQFFLSSTCFEYLVFVIRKTIQYCTLQPYVVYFVCIYANSLASAKCAPYSTLTLHDYF